MTERWKSISGFEHYEVSDLGRVRSLDHEIECLSRWGQTVRKKVKGTYLQAGNSQGYPSVSLGKGNSVKVHRLVASAFLAPDCQRTHVNHKDGIRSNNFWENLEWVTQAENNQHALTLPRKAAKTLRPMLVAGMSVPSIAAAAVVIGVTPRAVRQAANLRRPCKGVEVAYG